MPQIQNPAVPNLPLAPKDYDARQLEQLTRDLRTYFNKLRAAMDPVLYGFNHYGAFIRTTSQTNPVINTENLVEFDVTEESFGVALDATYPSRIVVNRAGVYNFQFSAQVDHTGGSAQHIHIWFKINGTSIPNSGSKVMIDGPNDEQVAAWNYMVTMQVGDYFELAWSSSDLGMYLLAEAAAAPVPAIPSVIMTVNYLFPNSAV